MTGTLDTRNRRYDGRGSGGDQQFVVWYFAYGVGFDISDGHGIVGTIDCASTASVGVDNHAAGAAEEPELYVLGSSVHQGGARGMQFIPYICHWIEYVILAM